MSEWAQRAKALFSKTCPPPTDKTDETPLLSVLSVPPQGVFEKSHGVSSVLSVPPGAVLEKPAPATPPTPPAPRSWLHLDAAWRRLDALYLQHHWTCTACKTAGAGRGDRCDTGQRLYDQLAQAVRSA